MISKALINAVESRVLLLAYAAALSGFSMLVTFTLLNHFQPQPHPNDPEGAFASLPAAAQGELMAEAYKRELHGFRLGDLKKLETVLEEDLRKSQAKQVTQ